MLSHARALKRSMGGWPATEPFLGRLALCDAESCMSCFGSVGGWPATEPFLAGGFGGLLYQKMLQAGVDALPAGAGPPLGQVRGPAFSFLPHGMSTSIVPFTSPSTVGDR